MLATLAATPALPALAQFRVEVTGVGLTQLPIAIAPFKGEGSAPQKISAIIQADLERSGQFSLVPGQAGMTETSQPQFVDWRARAADALGRGIGRSQRRMRGLDRLQFLEQLVVLGVGQRRRVQHVIQVGVMVQLIAQLAQENETPTHPFGFGGKQRMQGDEVQGHDEIARARR